MSFRSDVAFLSYGRCEGKEEGKGGGGGKKGRGKNSSKQNEIFVMKGNEKENKA